MTQDEYAQRSRAAVANAWAEFEGEGGKASEHGYSDAAVSFIDDNGVVAITDPGRVQFLTCFHEHFDRKHATSPALGMTVGQKRLRYLQQLKDDRRGKMLVNYRPIRGVPDD
jgi:hypothetical protein